MLTVVCQKIVIPQTDCYVPSYTPVTRLQDKKITIPRVICPSDFSSNTFAPSFALANWLDARLIPDGTTCITIIGHRGKHILSQSFSDHYKRTLLKFAGCHLRAQSPTGFPMNTKSKRSKDFSDPLTSIARRRGSDFSIDVSFNVFSLTKEDVGFEPTHAFTRLTVFKTVPFSQTWVTLLDVFPKLKFWDSRLLHGKRTQFSSPTHG